MFYFALWPSVNLIFAHILNLAGTEDFNHPQICVGILCFFLARELQRFDGFITLLSTLLSEAIPVVSRSAPTVARFDFFSSLLDTGNSFRLVNISPERIGGQEAWPHHRRRAFSTVRAV